MINKILKFWILFVATGLNSSFVFAVAEKDTGNLGEIRQSILAPDAFQRIYGPEWVLMDGRLLSETDSLYREGLWPHRNIPDARGVYLRATNMGRSAAYGSPDGDAHPCGTFLHDQIGSHTHSIAAPHTYYIMSKPKSVCPLPGLSAGGAFNDGNGITREEPVQPAAFGGNETRPRTLVVNTYIKINRTPPENEQNRVFTETLQNLPTRIVRNELLRGVLREMIREEVQRLTPPGSVTSLNSGRSVPEVTVRTGVLTSTSTPGAPSTPSTLSSPSTPSTAPILGRSRVSGSIHASEVRGSGPRSASGTAPQGNALSSVPVSSSRTSSAR
jgi:hypothetical protein